MYKYISVVLGTDKSLKGIDFPHATIDSYDMQLLKVF